MNRLDTKPLLADIYQAALAAVAPGPVLARALENQQVDGRVWVIALGKAARPMAEAAVASLAARGQAPAGGLVVSHVDGPPPHPAVEVATGDHPEPGAGSLAAADALDRLVPRVAAGDTVWVLLSGGTTSLIGAPQPGIAPDELKALYAQLLRSGLDIKEMNRVRKRFTRWSGGRLARALGRAARVRCFIVSDVIGDDLAAIGSGPCVPDPSTARDVRDALTRAGLLSSLAPSLRQHLDDVENGRLPETPKAGDPPLDRVESLLIASNRLALDAARRRASELGLHASIVDAPLSGEAAEAGAAIARQISAGAIAAAGAGAGAGTGARRTATTEAGRATPTRCTIWGGETTVTMGADGAGLGGRSQELSLAAARTLRGVAPPVALLAAGTDGRDGPTDAAGAVVDGATWDKIAATGRDPEADLRRHDAYRALAAAEALVKTGPTGTNVMDIVIAIE
jgi:hydroxypyruvate reductase